MESPLDDLLKSASEAIRRSFRSRHWWKFVQDDVKRSLDNIIENIGALGPAFKSVFRAFCAWEEIRLEATNQKIKQNQPTMLFRSKMTEVAFQSSLIPTRAILGLDDWAKANEADTYACHQLCEQIDLFENMGLFDLFNENKVSPKTDSDA